MKRIAYILIDKEENIFWDDIFKSLRKAEKQIDYGIKNKFFTSDT